MEKSRNPVREADPAASAQNAITDSLRDIVTLSRSFEQRLGRALGVNQTDLAAMEHLMRSGALSPSELAKRLGITPAAGTMSVDRLVALGHVERRTHPTDGRKVVVQPADASVALAIDELTPVIRGVATVVGELSDADRAVVEKFLGGVVAVYGDAVALPEE